MPDPTERKALAVSAFAAALLLFPLGGRISSVRQIFDRVSALMALGLSVLLFLFHVYATRKEERRADAVPAGPPPVPDAPSEPAPEEPPSPPASS